jgi:hypothetical protein
VYRDIYCRHIKQADSETAVSRVYKKEVKDASKVFSEEGTVLKIKKQTMRFGRQKGGQ